MPRSNYDNLGAALLGGASSGLDRMLEAIQQKRTKEAEEKQFNQMMEFRNKGLDQEYQIVQEGNKLKIVLADKNISANRETQERGIAADMDMLGIREAGMDRRMTSSQQHDFSLADKKHGFDLDKLGQTMDHDTAMAILTRYIDSSIAGLDRQFGLNLQPSKLDKGIPSFNQSKYQTSLDALNKAISGLAINRNRKK